MMLIEYFTALSSMVNFLTLLFMTVPPDLVLYIWCKYGPKRSETHYFNSGNIREICDFVMSTLRNQGDVYFGVCPCTSQAEPGRRPSKLHNAGVGMTWCFRRVEMSVSRRSALSINSRV